jgi:hypothetical protein
VVTDDIDGVEGLFGPSVQVYRSPEDLRRLASADRDAVFGDDATRRAVARRVGSEHSFAARAAVLVRIAHEELAARRPTP